ncbi:Topoisomerase 1-associated factor 1 [Blastomyces dermatitidis]|uniref:Topoisomerase 1-associated factor 1 n=2 Tax=Ajellomyces dermatitidis TaxID=5039 RepID=F2TNU0_AJEDA|nr:replication fork protection complex subunit Tof1/Swi1 [Blastomyces dermatitidis ER-3]EEQ85423.2 replication fork protection complex subunit Tof1/Swi1 [Blastomyces dermatitidis ER-3]EGE84903.1 replication fork protection complex subunit Tof1/Swi1 [Blastomyces dermatitidis ATCC 18188]
MESESVQPVQVVDPEVRAYVYSLITALGGSGSSDTGKYVLGDDALACLRDIKRWLKFYDEKANRMDVARCLAEANLVNRDLIPILTLWGDDIHDEKHKSRIALACLELLVPLTWPLEIHSQMTVNHHRHTPYLQQSQVLYKRGILGNDTTAILRTIIRIALPSMTTPRSDRSSRDEGILKLMLYLFRNLAIITPSPHLAREGDEEEASKSATINAFQEQDVFALLLTMCSNMGEDFVFQDVVILEILFHIVKGVDIEKLFMNDTQRSIAGTDDLEALLDKESHLKREYAKTAPTRHGRFGTMIWVKRDDEKVSTVSGQDVLKDDWTTMLKMDKTKKWNRPKHRRGGVDMSVNNFNVPSPLTPSATKNLRTFVEEFLDSGFNPLFSHLRKAIEREADRVTESTPRQFFYVISWFLEAERVRRTRQQELRQQNPNPARDIEPDSFQLVASVLNQETFIALNRHMQNCLDFKDWQDLNASMRCFTQILLTVQQMFHSDISEDQDIAENILSRIFYEETTHDRILTILRGYESQGFWYLDACTELAHVFLRLLEQYSKQNEHMQIRSRRRARRKQRKEAVANPENPETQNHDESEAEDLAMEDATRTIVERSFDFRRFAAKFCTQKSVNTFLALTTHYRELNEEQLKRAHRFFYRVAFKQELSVLLFRVDIISLFYRMIKGPGGLDSAKSVYAEWEELTRRVIRKLIKKLEQRPELITEMLFSKINATVFYLEYGHERQTVSNSKPAAELEVKPGAATTLDSRLGIVVAALHLEGKENLVQWLVKTLDTAVNERRCWELEAESRQTESGGEHPPSPPSIAVIPLDDACRTAMFKNGRFRLLMTLAGFERLGVEDTLDSSWIIPSSLSAKTLEETQKSVEKHSENPPTEFDGLEPRDLLRRKRDVDTTMPSHGRPQGEVDFGNDSEGEDDIDGILFPPNLRIRTGTLDELKKKRLRRGKKNKEDGDGPDEAALEARRLARQANALERQRKIKSSLYINASDEESDEEADREFFAREEERRKNQARRIKQALLSGTAGGDKATGQKSSSKGRKRKSTANGDENNKRQRSDPLLDSDDEDNAINIDNPEDDDDEDVMMATQETPSSSSETESISMAQPERRSENTTPPTSTERNPIFGMNDDDYFDNPFYFASLADKDKTGGDKGVGSDGREEEEQVKMPARQRRMLGAFIIDSDSESEVGE